MGKPTKSHFLVLPAEYIGRIEVTGGTETSKYPEEEKSNEIPLVVASERGYRTNRQLRKRWRGCRTIHCGVTKLRGSKTAWKGRPKRVKAPYANLRCLLVWHLSTAGHVKPGGNLGGPPSNPKYSLVTDSEPVP